MIENFAQVEPFEELILLSRLFEVLYSLRYKRIRCVLFHFPGRKNGRDVASPNVLNFSGPPNFSLEIPLIPKSVARFRCSPPSVLGQSYFTFTLGFGPPFSAPACQKKGSEMNFYRRCSSPHFCTAISCGRRRAPSLEPVAGDSLLFGVFLFSQLFFERMLYISHVGFSDGGGFENV